MKAIYTIDPISAQLRLTADPEERELLRQLATDLEGEPLSRLESEAMEYLLCNSELCWVDPADTGDLTDAPIIGILGSDEARTREQKGPFGAQMCGGDEGGDWYVPIIARWGFMSYALRSFVSDLIENGEAVFVSEN